MVVDKFHQKGTAPLVKNSITFFSTMERIKECFQKVHLRAALGRMEEERPFSCVKFHVPRTTYDSALTKLELVTTTSKSYNCISQKFMWTKLQVVTRDCIKKGF